ncbi:MAG TPA: formimidoylglutamate deiminase [Bryobacteraceae bacterium]|nr:formimidoylglutamate deiminase [Bryobacteraceae bacterium]
MTRETGWLPDLIYLDGRFASGVAMFADESGRISRFSSDPEDLKAAQRMAGRALLPGLVNVHSHAFQRVIRGRTEKRTAERDTFWTWRAAMYHAANRVSAQAMYDVARMAFLEMLLSGITTAGEFHYLHHQPDGSACHPRNLLALEILRAARDLGLRIALLRTAYVRAGWNKPPDPGQIRFLTPRVEDFIADTEALRESAADDRAWVGVAPHSIRAVPLDYLRRVAKYARENKLRTHMHVAEQPAEVDACLGEYGCRPVELLHREGLLDHRFTAIHAIHITPEEAGFLGNSQVCACPTSERNLGDGAVPADLLYNAGAKICFGTDSNIQIDVLEDARLLEYDLRMNKLQRVVLSDSDDLARRLFQSATESGADSLGSPGGKLEAGRAADFFTIDLEDLSVAGADPSSLLDHIVFSLERTAIREVFIGGKRVVQDGRHPAQEEVIRNFARIQRNLW